jgi:hypothetical protein
VDKIGQIIAPGAPLIREHVARVRSESTGDFYDCCTCHSNGLPAIRSLQTDHWFVITWAELIELAIARGVDRPVIEMRDESLIAHQSQPEVAHGAR